jgi:hypothetical protein
MQVALVAGAISIAVAIFTYFTNRRAKVAEARVQNEVTRLSHQLEREAETQDRQREALEVLARYRRPLLAAAVELRSRIGNIAHNNFFHYLDPATGRSELAVRTTLYRIASYLAWRELISRELTYLHYEDESRSKRAIDLLNHVSTQFSDSGLDFDGQRSRLMLWKEEQRAIGGLMLTGAPANSVIGFEQFTDRYEDKFAPWLDGVAADLQRPEAAASNRLGALSGALADLIAELDDEGVFEGRK